MRLHHRDAIQGSLSVPPAVLDPREPPAGPVHGGLVRITVAPGSVFTGPADDPSVGHNLVASGELTRLLETAVTVT